MRQGSIGLSSRLIPRWASVVTMRPATLSTAGSSGPTTGRTITSGGGTSTPSASLLRKAHSGATDDRARSVRPAGCGPAAAGGAAQQGPVALRLAGLDRDAGPDHRHRRSDDLLAR